MFCVNCGRQIDNQIRFCPFCGQPVPKETAAVPPTAVTPQVEPQQVAAEPAPTVTLQVEPPPAASEPASKKSGPWRRRLVGCSAALLVIIFLCSGSLAALYLWLGLNRSHQVAHIAPAETTTYISINPTVWQLPRLRHYDNLTGGAAIFAAVPGVMDVGLALQDLPINLTLDPQQDILSWMGNEVSLAIIADPAPVPGRGGGETLPAQAAYTGPTFMLAAVTRNVAASDALLAKVQRQLERDGVIFERANYRGIQIVEIASPPTTPLAWATVNNLVVIASDGLTLETALDAALDGSPTALAHQPAFQQAVANLSRSRLGYMIIQGDSLRELARWETELWQGIETAALTIALENNGLRLDYALQYDAALLLPGQLDFLENPAMANDLSSHAPASTVLYFSSHNLPLLWEAALNSDMRDLAHTLRTETQIRLEEDLLELASQQYALAVVADRDGFSGQPYAPYGVLMLTEVADRRMTERQLEDAGRRFSQRRNLPFYQDQISRTPVQILQLYGDNMIGYGFWDTILFVGSSEETLRLAVRAPNASLANNQLYQRANQPLPANSHIHLYVDVQNLIRASYETWPISQQEWYDDQLHPFLKDIRAVAATVAPMTRQGVLQGVVFVATE